jgi:hypothetical protein
MTVHSYYSRLTLGVCFRYFSLCVATKLKDLFGCINKSNNHDLRCGLFFVEITNAWSESGHNHHPVN